MARGRHVAIRSGHGVGKTTLLAWTVLWYVATRPFARVPCTAPTQHQLSDLLWAEISLWRGRAPGLAFLEWSATRLAMVGHAADWFAVARSSKVPENVAGFHAEHLLYVVDEASGVPDKVMQVVEGALTTAGAIVLLAGNPTRRVGYFADAFSRHRSRWHTIRVSSEDSPRVSPEYAEGMAAKWGADSDIYRVRVLGDFPRGEADTFIAVDQAEAAALREVEASGPCEIGLDVARYGDDETVFAVRRGLSVLPLECHRSWSIPETAGRAIQMALEQGATALKVDDSGLGGGVTDILQADARLRDVRCKVVAANFGGAGDEHYANATGVMWGRLRELLAGGEIALPDDPDLIGQLYSRRYTVNAAGKIALERKEDMKRRGLPSPDRADAVALAFGYPEAVIQARAPLAIPQLGGSKWRR